MKNTLVLDIGGSTIKYALMNCHKEFLDKGKVDAPRESEEVFLDTIENLYKKYEDKINQISISMAGKLNPKDGVIVSSAQYPFTKDRSLIEMIRSRCPVNVFVDNDANCAAIAELNCGSLTDVQNALVIVLGTGIGGSIIIGRKIYRGSKFCSSELSLIRFDGDPSLKKAWTFYGGAAGLSKMVSKAMNAKEMNGFEIFELVNNKDETVLKVLDEYCQIAAVQIYNLQAVLDVEKISIGGGISSEQCLIDLIRKHLVEIFEKESKHQLAVSIPKIEACAFRNDANLIGAWYLCNEDC